VVKPYIYSTDLASIFVSGTSVLDRCQFIKIRDYNLGFSRAIGVVISTNEENILAKCPYIELSYFFDGFPLALKATQPLRPKLSFVFKDWYFN